MFDKDKYYILRNGATWDFQRRIPSFRRMSWKDGLGTGCSLQIRTFNHPQVEWVISFGHRDFTWTGNGEALLRMEQLLEASGELWYA
jgi:hypothetical protein